MPQWGISPLVRRRRSLLLTTVFFVTSKHLLGMQPSGTNFEIVLSGHRLQSVDTQRDWPPRRTYTPRRIASKVIDAPRPTRLSRGLDRVGTRGGAIMRPGISRRLLWIMVLVAIWSGRSTLALADSRRPAGRATGESSRYVRSLETYRVPPVILVDQEGEQVALSSVLEGDKAVLVNFL